MVAVGVVVVVVVAVAVGVAVGVGVAVVMPKQMPAQKPATSRQDYSTPWPVVRAAESWLFGGDRFTLDIAADEHNRKAPRHVSAKQDAIRGEWEIRDGERAWCNSPFGLCGQFASMLRERTPALVRAKATVVMLTPASIGTVWYADHAFAVARTVGLSPRITFEGETAPYPKDLAVLLYGLDPRTGQQVVPGLELWNWRRELGADYRDADRLADEGGWG